MNERKDTTEQWEDRSLGASEEHVVVAGLENEQALDDSLGMQMISIRLPRDLISAYKLIANHHGVGYQPLMRDILQRFVPEGLKEVMRSQERKSSQAEERIAQLKKVA